MAYRIAEKPPLRIVGIRIPLTSDMEENLRIVPEFWEASLQGKQFLEIQSVFKRFYVEKELSELASILLRLNFYQGEKNGFVPFNERYSVNDNTNSHF